MDCSNCVLKYESFICVCKMLCIKDCMSMHLLSGMWRLLCLLGPVDEEEFRLESEVLYNCTCSIGY